MKNKFITVLRKASPTLLSVFASAGVVGTAILTARATVKAYDRILDKDEKEPFLNHAKPMDIAKEVWRCYIPAASAGAATIVCIFGANVLNKRSQATVAAAYQLARSSFDEYQAKLKELYGEEAHNSVMDAIVKEKCDFTGIYAECFGSEGNLGITTDAPEVKRTFFDEFSQRYFESTLSNVIQAEYHLNRNYSLGGGETLNDFYEFLGIAPVDGGDALGWDMGDGVEWIDFNHRVTTLDDGMEVVLIKMIFGPSLPIED